ncbi:hypothetical protein NMY22_g5110 [Coprinellus aureogranulatus]|nr:hypothetical protein NMY22_g5110 [Coprinellus aureogranulatus]
MRGAAPPSYPKHKPADAVATDNPYPYARTSLIENLTYHFVIPSSQLTLNFVLPRFLRGTGESDEIEIYKRLNTP